VIVHGLEQAVDGLLVDLGRGHIHLGSAHANLSSLVILTM
jgi:hypothetical protein